MYSLVSCRLFPFPTLLRNPDGRQRWKEAVNRADAKRPWKYMDPSKDQRVCSEHFVDGEPTEQHPDPELHLGYELPDSKRKKPRVTTQRVRVGQTPETTTGADLEEGGAGPTNYCDNLIFFLYAVILLFSNVVSQLRDANSELQRSNKLLKAENNRLFLKLKTVEKQASNSLTKKLLRKDKDCRFYTGIEKCSVFQTLHDYVAPYVKRRWKGSCRFVSTKVKRLFVKSPSKFGPGRKLSSTDEFLLVLMRMRLGLLNADLARRFDISPTLCSQIFHTWLTAMDSILGALVFWPDKEQILATKPQRYRHLPDIVSIIDCSEVFIETPKNLDLQFATWSDYKHHNTLKYLISVAPNSAITYLSPLYCGRISDKALTNDCSYLDMLDPYDQIMADKGFLIYDECAARSVSLHVPPGKRGIAQMLPCQLSKTKRIANLRILVEQVIRRMKTFRMLKYEMPLSVVYLADKVVRVVGGLCNLQKPIYDC